jgi:hypothetical protein
MAEPNWKEAEEWGHGPIKILSCRGRRGLWLIKTRWRHRRAVLEHGSPILSVHRREGARSGQVLGPMSALMAVDEHERQRHGATYSRSVASGKEDRKLSGRK